MTAYYTKFYDWIAQQKDLTLLEKLIICNVLRYKKGCYESYRGMARKFGVSHSHIIKSVKSLIAKDWLCVLYEGKYKRILYVVPERLKPGPLWEQSGYYRDRPGNKSGHYRDHVVNNVNLKNKFRELTIVNSAAESMSLQAKPPSKNEKLKRRQLLKNQCDKMKKGEL